MVVVRRQHIEWHDPSCSAQHFVKTSTFVACLSCGSFGPPPPATLPPLPSESSIRLLWLLPGSIEDPIECHVRVQSLSSGPLFSAISYTWADDNGDDTKCEEVIVDGQPVHVSRNCHAALKRVRRKAATSIIWIDAVCIDQNHAEERGHQVKLMPQIYLQAQTVFVYIGEHHSGSLDLIDAIGQISNGHNLGQTTTLSVPVLQKAWHSLLARKYFSRLWILQELALAKYAVVLCGDSSLAWHQFTNCSRLMDERYGIQQHSIFMFQRSLYMSLNKELFLLDHGRRAHAKDPKDKIYGLLGLLPGKRLGDIVADYTIPVERLYVKVAFEIARVYGWKFVLDRAGTERQNISSLPSWAPDWSFTGESQIANPNSETLQRDFVDRNHISINLIKHPSDDDKWLLLDKAIGTLHAYFFFGLKSVFYKHILLTDPVTSPRLWSTDQGLYLSLTAQPSLNSMTKSLCTTLGVENDHTSFICLTDAIRAFPLTMEELKICANDEYTLRLKGATGTEAAESPSSVLKTLRGEYFRLCAAKPVEDWVLEAEELWASKAENLWRLVDKHDWASAQKGRMRARRMRPRKKKTDDELYAANDAFWRLLVRRFALREQVVHIA